MRRSHGFLLLLTQVFVGASLAQKQANRQRSNIILIVADDLGYGNLSCYHPRSATVLCVQRNSPKARRVRGKLRNI